MGLKYVPYADSSRLRDAYKSGNQAILCTDNGLAPTLHRASTLLTVGMLLIDISATNFRGTRIANKLVSVNKTKLNVSSAKSLSLYRGLRQVSRFQIIFYTTTTISISLPAVDCQASMAGWADTSRLRAYMPGTKWVFRYKPCTVSLVVVAWSSVYRYSSI